MPIPNYATATYAAQAELDSVDVDILAAGPAATGVVSGCAVTPNAPGSTLVVAVAAGTVAVSGVPVAVTGTTLTPAAAHGTNGRFDLITVTSAGTPTLVAGTAATVPVFPALPATSAALAAVFIPAAATSIVAGNIVDKRVMLGVLGPSIVTVSTNTTLAASNDVVLVNSNAAARTITLPTAVGFAKPLTIKRLSGGSGLNSVTVATTSSQTIEGVTTWTLTDPGDSVTVAPSSGNWVVI